MLDKIAIFIFDSKCIRLDTSAAYFFLTVMKMARHWAARSFLLAARVDEVALNIISSSLSRMVVDATIMLLFLYGDREQITTTNNVEESMIVSSCQHQD